MNLMSILIVADDNQTYWSGDSWVKDRSQAREYSLEKRDVAMGLASKLGAKAIVGLGTQNERKLGNVPKPIPNPVIVEAEVSKPEHKKGQFDLSQLTIENYQVMTGSRFRLTNEEKASGVNREVALRARIKAGKIGTL